MPHSHLRRTNSHIVVVNQIANALSHAKGFLSGNNEAEAPAAGLTAVASLAVVNLLAARSLTWRHRFASLSTADQNLSARKLGPLEDMVRKILRLVVHNPDMLSGYKRRCGAGNL